MCERNGRITCWICVIQASATRRVNLCAMPSARSAPYTSVDTSIIVGGTMLYLRALYSGLAQLPIADPALRAQIDAAARVEGWPAMHAQLAAVDPAAAARIDARDAQRIQRALEVYRLSGRPISSWQAQARPADGPQAAPAYRWLQWALVPASRERLRARLVTRFEAMLRAGLVEEVQHLYARGDLHPDLPSIRAVGYRQLWSHVAGASSLEQATAAAVTATAQLAKRQLTWLRREPAIRPVEIEPGADLRTSLVPALAAEVAAALEI